MAKASWFALALLLGNGGVLQALPSACNFESVFNEAHSALLEGPASQATTLPVVLLNRQTCETKKAVGVRRGNALLVSGFTIKLEERARWNGINTSFEVVKPEGWVVLANRWRDWIYVPYSTGLIQAFPHLAPRGEAHHESDIDEALFNLDAKSVYSTALPGVPMSYLGTRFRKLLSDIAWAEHVEEWEAFEKAKTILGANPQVAFPTCNSMRACGLMQITQRTCTEIRKDHPHALLPEDCHSGGREHSHVISIEAAILVLDQKLRQLMAGVGLGVLFDERLDVWLFAAYNGGTERLIPALKTRPADWDKFVPDGPGSQKPAKGSIFRETAGYVQKYYRLNPPTPPATPVATAPVNK